MKDIQLINSGQTVCVIGLGVTGRSAVRYCFAQGARVRVSDMRAESVFLEAEGEFLEKYDIEWEAGGHTLEFCSQSDVVLPSPGIDQQSEFILGLKEQGKNIAGELAVVAANMDIPVIAVTGTNGKTTVTSLIGDVLKRSGKRVFVGGNIGTPMYEYCLSDSKYDVIVAEVSSFQLECSGTFSPKVGVLLNITPDHLDRHRTFEKYQEAKARLFCNQGENDYAVISGDDPGCKDILLPQHLPAVRFGRGQDNTLRVTGSSFQWKNGEKGGEFVHGLNGSDGFTCLNFAAAYAALKRMGLIDQEIASGFLEFESLPHRLEFVAKNEGVIYINDSKATNTGAVIGALEEMTTPVVLIAGGKGKGEDYSLLRDSITVKVHTLVLLGEEAASMEKTLGDLVSCLHATSMEEAVALARSSAKRGDTVLLSPGCASFDMFSSYGNRGDMFKEAVGTIEG